MLVVTVILAAGRSSRMGRPKALLPHADGTTTFLAHGVSTCRAAGAGPVLVVGRTGDAGLRAETERLAATFVTNPDPDRGQLSSLLAGLDVAERDYAAEAIMVLPVDVPLITTPGIRALLDAATMRAEPIVRAVSGGRHGHPVIFKRAVFAELRDVDPALGARAVVRADAGRVAEVDVGSASSLIDVDTPDDYRRAFGRPV